MSVKPDHWIRRMALEHKMIEPFTDRQVREGVISYGVSSYGYDIRVADEFQTNLIMPEPTLFLDPGLGPVSIIRPTSTEQGGAVASVESFVNDGLFLNPATGRNTGIVEVLMELAVAADNAKRTM